MAFSNTLLLPHLLFSGFLFTSMVVHSSTPGPKCPSFDCGDGLTIHYPFWIQSRNSDHCGYPGFNVSCSDKKPMLRLSNSLYRIKTINYSANSLVLAYSEIRKSGCPRIDDLISVSNTTTPSLFNYSVGNKILNFFYNCSLYPPSLPHITCLEHNSKHSYVFVEGSIPEFDWHKYCEYSLKLSVLDTSADGDIVQNFGEALGDGFRLTWKKPDGLCQDCEGSGGFCDYTKGQRWNFSCVCSDGRQLRNCYDKAAPSRHEPTTYVVIGGLIFGGLVIAATAFYFVQKRKFASYKPV